MRNALWSLIVFCGLVAAVPQAYAGDWAFGFKLAYFDFDDVDIDDPDNAGILIGYDWDVKYGSIGIEADYTTDFLEGEYLGQDVEADTAGLYAVYRTRGPATKGIGPYLKLKVGAAYNEFTVGTVSEDDTNFSAGIGLGLNMHAVSFELEFTTLGELDYANFGQEDDVNLISLTVRF